MNIIEEQTLAKAHNVLYDMLCEVDSIFRRNNVRYIISFGTLLGAVRHKGFIPWDDDIDIHVYNEDYDKASEALRRELNAQKYILHDAQSDPYYWCTFARVRDLYSEVVFVDNRTEEKYQYKGLQVSLLKAPLAKERNRFWYKLIKETSNSKDYNKHLKDLKSRCKWLISSIALPIEKIIFQINELLPGRTVRILGNMAWSGQYYDESELSPFKELEFRNTKFLAPNQYDKVLKDAYGDYMQIPPPEKREVHFKEIIFGRNSIKE